MNRQSKNVVWCGTCAAAVCACFCLLSALFMIPAGFSTQAELEDTDTDDHFNYLGHSCIILGMTRSEITDTHSKNSGSDKQTTITCYDVYEYDFNIEGVGPTYRSREEKVERNRRTVRGSSPSTSCTGTPEAGSHAVGDMVECWQPKSLPVDDVYTCGNNACIKIFDPKDDLASAMAEAAGLIAGGFMLLVCGCGICCCCVGGGSYMATRPETPSFQQPPYEQPGGGAPTMVGMPMGVAVATPVQATVVQAPISVSVQVPLGALPGQTLHVQTPDGRTVQAVIPEGVDPGQQFTVSVPG